MPNKKNAESRRVAELKKAIMEKRFGNGSRIYLVNENTIGKRCWNYETAGNGFRIGRLLHKRGVQVPKMHDLVKIDGLEGIMSEENESWFIFMQRIKDKRVSELSNKEKRIALEQHKREMTKVLDLSIFPFDSYQGYESCLPQNALFDAKENKVYLIDFEFWRAGTEKEIEDCRKNLDTFYEQCVWK